MIPIPLTAVEAAADRLYRLLPEHLRSTDAANGWGLRALVTVLTSGSAEIDREIDTLYAATFVETAPEAALDAIAALVGAEPLRPLPPGADHNARAYIANTLRYRRGKGTARILEALAADVGGYGAAAVEYFMRLARTQNLIDVRPERPSTATLTDARTASHAATAFDTLPRLVDVRSIARAGGRHHVRNIGVHVLRHVTPTFAAPPGGLAPAPLLPAADVARMPVMRDWPVGGVSRPGYFQLAALPDHMVRLLNPNRRADDSSPRVHETDLPARLNRMALHRETEELRQAKLEGRIAAVGNPPWFSDTGQPFTVFLRRQGNADFERVAPEEIVLANLETAPGVAGARPAAQRAHQWFTGSAATAQSHSGTSPIRCGFDPVTGRLIVAVPAAGQPDVVEVRIAYATGLGMAIGAGAQDRNSADVPFDIRDTATLRHFIRIVDGSAPPSGSPSDPARQVQSLAEALADWENRGAGMRGLIVLTRCDRELPLIAGQPIEIKSHPDTELHIVAAQWRPKIVKPGLADDPDRHGYVVRREARYTVDGRLLVTPKSAPPSGGRAGAVIIDGIEVTGGITLGSGAVSRLWLRHCTIRNPGGSALATTMALQGAAVEIAASLIGRIDLGAADTAASGTVTLHGSIVAQDGAATYAIRADALDATIAGTTILGASSFKRLDADNSVFGGTATVARKQSGCVRYSSVAPGSVLPRRFRCQPDLATAQEAERLGRALTGPEAAAIQLGALPRFLDTSLDEPTVAMLHPLCSTGIRLGGEGDSEMGAFSVSAEGLRRANLVSLFDDYLPFGCEAGIIDDTHSTVTALRRNRP